MSRDSLNHIKNGLRKLQADKDRKQKPGPNLGHVTIFTDASFDGSYRVGGYAYQIVGPFETVKAYGGFREQMDSIHLCELAVIAIAINRLFYKIGAPNNLTIYSDSLAALDMIGDEGKHEKYRDIHEFIREEIKKRGLRTLSLRHVPAHSEADLRRVQINNWCDKFAKRAMKARLDAWKRGDKGEQD